MDKSNYHWYILSVRGGKEEKVLEKIKLELKNNHQDNKVSDLKIIKNNKQEKLKGFIFCYAHLDHDLLQIFYKVSEVTGFLGHPKESKKLPDFVSEETIKTFSKSALETKKTLIENSLPLSENDLVKITVDSFTYEGRVVKIIGQKVSIEIKFVGKKTILDNVPINSVKKVF